METVVKLLQFSKALEPMSVTELGISIEVKLLQPKNARSPMFVTEFGIFIETKLLQPLKPSMLAISFPNITVLSLSLQY